MNEKYPMALPEGTVLAGQYIVDKVLGQGGFGITYMATDHKTGQRVAIKEFFPDALATRHETIAIPFNGERSESFEYGKKCFMEEAQTLAQFIGNENIVRIHTYFEENDTGYFVMDFIEGTSLDDYIKEKGGKLDWEETASILVPVMDALAAVHARGIVHRDVTPDNIYITKDGTVKLLDFGAARYSIGDKSRSLDIVLKHGFAPKEQYIRRGRQGPYTDVYALGATFYFALTGQRPPDSVARLEEDELIPPSTLGVKLPEAVENAILQALSVNAADRFQTMTAFKRAMKISAEGAKAQEMPQPQVSAPVVPAAPQVQAAAPQAPAAPQVPVVPAVPQAYNRPVGQNIPPAPVIPSAPAAAPVMQQPVQPVYSQPVMQNAQADYTYQQGIQAEHVQPKKSKKAVIGIIVGAVSLAAVAIIVASIVIVAGKMKENDNTVRDTTTRTTTGKVTKETTTARSSRGEDAKGTSALVISDDPADDTDVTEDTEPDKTAPEETGDTSGEESKATKAKPTATPKPVAVKPNAVSASAYYTQSDGKAFTPDLAIDGNLKTAWNVRGHSEVDGSGKNKTVTTKGVGEYMDFYFAPGTALHSIKICPGFCYDDKKVKRFEKNYAPTSVTITAGDKSYEIDLFDYAFDLDKASKGCTFVFPEWLTPENGVVRLTINSVRNIYEDNGQSFWKDCCISEVSFKGAQE